MCKLGNNQIDLQPRESKVDDTAKDSMRAIAASVLQKITGTDKSRVCSRFYITQRNKVMSP